MVDGHPASRRRSSAKADPIDGNLSHRPFVAAIIEMSARSTGSRYSKKPSQNRLGEGDSPRRFCEGF
jgi:hypothetical protein